MGKPRGGYIGFKEGGARVGKPRGSLVVDI